MNKSKYLNFSIAICLSLASATFINSAYAQEASTPDGSCKTTLSARNILRDEIVAFRASEFGHRLQQRADSGEIVLVISDAISVKAPLSQADFGKSRDMAFAQSFLNAQGKFILLKNRDIQTEIISERFDQAPSREQMKFSDGETDGEYWQLGNKLFRLADAKLNSALAEEGVPEEEFINLNPKKKVDLYRESLTRKTIQSVMGRIAGLLPVMNLESSDCQGRVAVATVAVFSQSTLDFTQAFINGKAFMPEVDAKADKSISQQILDEISSNEIIDIWGLRKVRDEQGYPALVAYGQWSYVTNNGSVRSNERREDSALMQAENNAVQQLALFLNGTASFRNETEIQDFENEFVELEKTKDGIFETTEVIDEIVERTFRRTAARAKVSLKGLSSAIQWVKPYPNEASAVQLTGAVVYWTPTLEDSINQAVGSNQRRAGGKTNEAAVDKVKEAETRKSKVKNDARDF
jgi:hypothetical protein